MRKAPERVSPPPFRVQEELGAVTAVEVLAAAGEVAPDRLGRLSSDRDDPLLVPLAEHPHGALVEVDTVLLQADGFGDPEPGAVEQLDESAVAESAR